MEIRINPSKIQKKIKSMALKPFFVVVQGLSWGYQKALNLSKNQRVKAFKVNWFVMVLILLIGIFSKWFFSNSILSTGDWYYYFPEKLNEFINVPYLWDTIHFGSSNLIVSFAPSNFLWAVIAKYLGFAVSERILYLGFGLINTYIWSYVLVKKVTLNRIAGVVGALVYTLNTYILTVISSGHILIFIGISLIPLILYLYIRGLEERSLKIMTFTAIVSIICTFFEFRMYYLTVFILFFYLAIFVLISKRPIIERGKSILRGIYPVIVTMIANTYWLLGLGNTGDIRNNEVFNRGLFGSQYFDISYAMTLYHPYWTGGEIEFFVRHMIQWQFYLLPILAFIGLYLFKRNKNILYFGLLALTGILLAKQTDMPFNLLYEWLYEHIPGFNAFREASKFYSFIALAYAVLIGNLVAWISNIKYKKSKFVETSKVLAILCIAGLFLFNVKPILTGEINGMFKDRTIPKDYVAFKDYVNNQDEYFRTLWIPHYSRWSFYSNSHPLISFEEFVKGYQGLYYQQDFNNRSVFAGEEYKIFFSMIDEGYFDYLLDKSSIKYVVVPIQDTKNDDDFFKYFPYTREEYIKMLDQVESLAKLEGNFDGLIVYENKNFVTNSYIRTVDDLYSFDDGEFRNKFKFVEENFESDFDFVNSNSKDYTIDVYSLFDTIKNDPTFETYQIGQTKKTQTFFQRNDTKEVYSSMLNGNLEVYLEYPKDIYLDDSPISKGELATKQIIFTKKNIQADYYIALNGKVIKVLDGINRIAKVKFPARIEVLARDYQNLVENGDFNEGPWDTEVLDCNNYDENAKVSQEYISSGSTQHIILNAKKHIACTKKKVDLQNTRYFVSGFKYNILSGENAGFAIIGSDGEQIINLKLIQENKSEWKNFQKIYERKEGVSSVDFYLYAYETDGKKESKIEYDNVYVNKLIPVYMQDFELISDQNFVNQTINGDLLQINEANSKTNLIQEPSFEKGLWQSEVGDCHNFDEVPMISMALDSEKSSDGNNSLRLESTRHNACTYNVIDVEESSDYLFYFDYFSQNAENIGYYISFDDEEKTSIENKFPNDARFEWKNFATKIKTPANATKATLTIYSFSKDGIVNIVTNYDNFGFFKTKDFDDTYYLVANSQNPETKVDVTVNGVSPTKKRIKIKDTTAPFVLILNEKYHPSWDIYIDENINQFVDKYFPVASLKYISSGEDHFEINGNMNGWYIDPAEVCKISDSCLMSSRGEYSFDLVIEYTPQRWVFSGLIISAITVMILAIFVILVVLGVIDRKVYVVRRNLSRALFGQRLQSREISNKDKMIEQFEKILSVSHDYVRHAMFDLYSKLWIFIILATVATTGAYIYGLRPYFILMINLFLFAVLYEWAVVFIFIFSIISILSIPFGFQSNAGLSEIVFANSFLLIFMVVGVTLVKHIPWFSNINSQKIKNKINSSIKKADIPNISPITTIAQPFNFGIKFLESTVKLIKKSYKKKKGVKVGKIRQIRASKKSADSKFKLKRKDYSFDCNSRKNRFF